MTSAKRNGSTTEDRLRARIAELEERLSGRDRAGDGATYRELFERSTDPILIIEGDRFVDCNDAAVRILRCNSRRQVLQNHPWELSPPTQPDGKDSHVKAEEMIALAFSNGSHRFEWDHMTSDGEIFPVEVLLTAFHDRGKAVLHVVWRDISERKQLEDQLRQSQKMEAVGQLAGGIAHDFNNILVAIVGYSDLLEAELVNRPDLLDHVREIQQAGDRAVTLVRQLLAFSRKQETHPLIVDLNGQVEEVDKLLQRLINENVRLQMDLNDGPLPVFMDPVHVEQVIVNLITNARDAMPDGGVLTIKTAVAEIDADRAEELPAIEAGRFAVLEVVDNGCGMDRATAARAFEPFFTTKEVGEGTGLGLATVYGIVQRARGAITCESEPGEGTRIEVLLPISRKEPEAGLQSKTSMAARGHETVLVVEDEPAVAGLAEKVLRAHGYRVLTARDGLEALAIWDVHENEIDLVLTDTIMPNLGGAELADELSRRNAHARVLFMSGYTRERLAQFEKVHGAVDMLEKPFTAAQLATRVLAALNR